MKILHTVIGAQKGTSLRGTTSFDVFCVKTFRGVGCSLIEKTQRTKKNQRHGKITYLWFLAEIPEPIATKFCTPGVHNLIMHVKFGEYRLRGFGVARGRIWAFFIDLLPCYYNTRAGSKTTVVFKVFHPSSFGLYDAVYLLIIRNKCKKT